MRMDRIENVFKEKYETALVTGGAGFIGSHIVEKLVGMGLKVISIDNYSAGKRESLSAVRGVNRFCEIDCDISNEIQLRSIFERYPIEIVFHNAASKKNICLVDPRKDLDVNGKGTFNLLELSREFSVKKFVHASTGSVYGEPVVFPQTEEHPLNPTSYYGVSKLAGERYVNVFHRLYDLDTTILRYFHVYGPRQDWHPQFGGVVSIFIKRILENSNPIIFGSGDQERSFTSVFDVVNANILVAVGEESKGQVYNCASGIAVSINQLCEFLLNKLDQSGILQPEFQDWLVGDIEHFEVDNTKIRNLGADFEVDFWKGITPTIEWLTEKIAGEHNVDSSATLSKFSRE